MQKMKRKSKLNCSHLQSGGSIFTKSKSEAKQCIKELRKEPHQVKVTLRRTKHTLLGKGWLIHA